VWVNAARVELVSFVHNSEAIEATASGRKDGRANPPSVLKLLVFAHTPPPHHGQSYMVELMLAGFGGDQRRAAAGQAAATGAVAQYGIACYHVNARLSKKLEDIGDFRVEKLLLLLGYCVEAIWCRFRYGTTTFYYIPAPGKPSALYRDWVVMLLCRCFFKRVILHWHAAGLAKWLETTRQIRTRAVTYRLLKNVDASIVLSRHNWPDAEKLWPKQIKVVGNGIPDPCPNFVGDILPRRKARVAARRKLLAGETLSFAEVVAAGDTPHLFNVLYLAHCTREKGLFDTLEAVALGNQRLARANARLRLRLTVAGEFINAAEQMEFTERVARADLQLPLAFVKGQAAGPETETGAAQCPAVIYRGFVGGEEKTHVLAESDCFCFPTYYYAESFGLVVVEAMAFGSAVVASRWRSIPELLPPNYPGLVDIRAPEQIARALLALLGRDAAEELRALFVQNFTLEQHLVGLAEAFHSAEHAKQTFAPEPVASRP
jgi:glycosyltransferase involved in cell wall biosynthesis